MPGFDINISFDMLKDNLFIEKGIEVSMARLDKIHPEVSGNKLFKLRYSVEACEKSNHKTLLNFGGAYSNHLAAAAFLCNEKKLACIGIVRGEEPKTLSHTLLRCRDLGMQLHFISRSAYQLTDTAPFIEGLKSLFGEFTLVPEGGYSAAGAKGAADIMELFTNLQPTHICTPAGTATTAAGLMMKKPAGTEIIAVPVLKNLQDLPARIRYLTGADELPIIFADYHFGGYAKYNPTLLNFINAFYESHRIPLDFVYTAKMMYAVTDKIKTGFFKEGSRIICLHTGGLQGNKSLPAKTLIFE